MINSWTINLVLGILLSVIAGGGFFIWKSSIEAKAVLELKAQQLEKTLADQQKAMEDTAAILKESTEIVSDLKDQTSKLNDRFKNLDVYLDNNKDTKQSSEVLKRTFKELSQ